MGFVELWHTIDGWVIILVICLPVLARVVIVTVALRGAQPADRPKIITALAEMFRWWRRSDPRGPGE